jgi:hypothetical protein
LKKNKVGSIILYGTAGLLLLLTVCVGALHLYQDKIIGLFVAEANKHIKTKVEVGNISLSLFEKFPQVAVTLDQVVVTEAVEGSEEPLAKISRIFCTFSLPDIIFRTYDIRQLYLEQGEVYVKVLKDGKVNYRFFEGSDTTGGSDLSFNLKRVVLTNVQVHYDDEVLRQSFQFLARDLKASLAFEQDKMDVQAEGDVLVETIRLEADEYFKEKEVYVKGQLAIDQEKHLLTLAPSLARIGEADYQVAGTIGYGGPTTVDLALEGKNTSVQSLLALLPQQMSQELRQYRSKGDIYFNGSAKGEVSAKASPLLTFAFGCREATFYHPDLKQQVENVSFAGSFTNGSKKSAQTSVLELKDVRGSLRGRPFSGSLHYQNFTNPSIKLVANADVDLEHVLGAFPVAQITRASGQAKININFSGNLKAFEAKPGNATINTSGEVTLRNVSVALKDHRLPVSGVQGNFIFRKNDMAVSDFKGKVGNSDFKLNGFLKNFVAWTLLNRQRLLIEADLESSFLDFDQLLRTASAESQPTKGGGAKQEYALHISPNIACDINASIGRGHFRRFKGQNIKGTVQLRQQVITTSGISFEGIGGEFSVKGSVNAQQPNHIKAATVARMDHMRVDSLFYIFENFGQDFIMDRHLKGDLIAEINSELYFDRYLNAKTNLTQAEIKMTVRNGQLINFEPMQKLSAFINRKELANLKFSELTNNFWIQEQRVYIPEMAIQTNTSKLSAISFSGTHTFDNKMDYKLRIPILANQRRREKEEEFGPVAVSNAGSTNLFLSVKGNVDNYKFAYDAERVKDKIAQDLKQEKKELKDIFTGRKKQQQQEKKAEQEEEYFDF